MAEILSICVGLLGALPGVKQYVIDPLSYLCCSGRNLKKLEDQVKRLETIRVSLQKRVDDATRECRNIQPEVKKWLDKVEDITKRTDMILVPRQEVQRGRVNGSCPNLKLRYSVSKKAKKMADIVADEVNKAPTFDEVAEPAPRPVTSGTEFPSRKAKEEEIMAALSNDDVYMIGICGMGGTGKTTMVHNIWKRVVEKKLIDVVAMATASQQLDKKKIQNEIAGRLNLQLKEEEMASTRATTLCTTLTKLGQTRSILIILDDIWDPLNLVEIGIPSPGKLKRFKIILTSRDQGVCESMKANLSPVGAEIEATKMEIIKLECLVEKEAWDLFRTKAGTVIDRCGLDDIAQKVARECKGLPLALVTVGCAMAETNAQENPRPAWKDALGQLQKAAPANITGVLKNVYGPLTVSYHNLPEEAMSLFLLCCLFPEDSQISLSSLVYIGFGMRKFSNVDCMKNARDRVDTLVETLTRRHMLIKDRELEGIKCVKMHDVLRDVAIYIASTSEDGFMTSHGLKDWPREKSFQNCTHISLALECRVTFPKRMDCPKLKMLRMEYDWFEDNVPDTFFEGMGELNVLDIEGIGSLPSSLRLLTNLRTLRLRYCNLETASMIGQLVNLEILDLRNSTFEVLPKEIGGLEKLKSLDLSECDRLREIAPGVITRLARLEELFVANSFTNWEAEVEGKERGNASLVEVASLKNLTALEIEIPDPKVLPQDTLHWSMLERFRIWIGTASWDITPGEYRDKSLIVDLNETTPLVHALIRKAQLLNLKLGGMCANDEVISSIQGGNQDLKWLSLEGCGNIKDLANISNALQCLKLKDLCELTHLFDQKLSPPYPSEVYIENCSSLQYVFLQSTAKSLSQLKILEIKECPVLEEVFKAERGESADVVNRIVFPNLTTLRLNELPNLNSFCKAVNEIDFPLLEDLHIEGLHNLKVFCPMEESSFFEQGEHNSIDGQFLFHQKVTFASIRWLTLDSIDTATNIFSSQIPVDSFNQLEALDVCSCPNLKVIFSPPAFRNFRNLKRFSIWDCLNLEAVVGKEDEKAEAAANGPLFPKLLSLELRKLPNFKNFCHMKNDIELPKLESITIEDCQQMETFSPRSLSLPCRENVFGLSDPNLATQSFFNREVFASLVELKLSNSNATKIFSSQIPVASFSQLRLLEVNSCPNLEVIFSPPSFRNFRNLKELRIHDCRNLEAMVGKEDEKAQTAAEEPLFPELKTLTLKGLPNFKKFCHMKIDIDWQKLESVTLDDCPQMDPNVATQFFHNKEVTFASIRQLKLGSIDIATKLFSSQIPVDSFSQLESLDVFNCPNLKVIFSPLAFRNFRKLEWLRIWDCLNLEAVVGKEDEKAQAAANGPLFPKLRFLRLRKLPNFKKFCHMKNDIELPKLESITIEDCQQMETFSPRSLSVPCRENVFGLSDPNLATQIFFNKEVTFASLVEMKLYNITTATKLFSSKIPIASFSQLELLEVQSCPNLKIIFSPLASRNFKSLHSLTLKDCSNLEEVIAMEDEGLQTVVTGPLFPELEKLVLSELPNIKLFCYMKNGMELPQLKNITIEGCHKMETFSLGSLNLPHLTYIFGLLEPEVATRIFCEKEIPKHEIHLENDSFTLSAKDLSIFDGDDMDSWEWCLAKDSSDNFMVVARQWKSCELKISGRFEMIKLSPETLYEVVLEIMLDEDYFFCIRPVNIELTQSEGITKERFEDLDLQPTGKWIQVLVGEFITSPDPIGDLEFSFYSDDIEGLVIKGVTIRPKT